MKLHSIISLIATLAISTTTFAEGVKEVLMGFDIEPNSIVLHVASGGCTSKSDFKIDIKNNKNEQPPLQLTVLRLVPDYCEAHIPNGIELYYDRAALGLSGDIEFTLTNTIGTTSQHY
ncbi:hypothetical protein [Zooshikella harenae]|uniref:Uncharacterized protein n=1 Tax=Zooshikella harenae TaxID=2827238 RepID=A0ABS5Z8X3_9GAMM|nr:hypothetical protein [Zooshikella harenae]MBU2710495.1 hypothetical protein [Zooshikella harenae]